LDRLRESAPPAAYRLILSAPGNQTFSPRQLIPAVYAPSLLHAVGAGMLGPALPLYAHELEISLLSIGMLAALQGLGAVAMDVPAGLLVSRIGGRAAMSLGMLASGAGSLALALSTTPNQLFLAVPLAGAGTAIWATSRLAHVADVAPAEQRGRALAMVGGTGRIGLAVGPVIGGLLSQQLGLRAAFLGHTLLALTALVLVATQRGHRGTPGRRQEEGVHLRLLRTVADHGRSFANAGSVAVSLATLRSGRRLLVPLWGAALGLDLAQIGFVIGLGAAVDMLLFYPVGVVMDRWGRKWTIVPCLLLLSTSLALFPLTGSLASFLAVTLLAGFGNGLGSGAVMTMGADLAPSDRRGEFLGVWRLIADSGGVLAPALAGSLAQALSLGAAFPAVAVIGAIGALVMVFRVPEGLRLTKE